MKKTLIALCALLVTHGAFADAGKLAAIKGSYNCNHPSDDSNSSQVMIDADKSTITVVRREEAMTGSLVDKSELLLPLKKDLGISLFVVMDNGKPAINFEFLKTPSGRLLIIESGAGLGGYRSPSDESQSTKASFQFAPDAICMLSQ